MKIVFVFNAYSEQTGYISNCLPKSMAKIGHEVHIIAPNVQVYFNSPDYEKTYGEFLGPPILPVETKELDGFTLHRLPHAVRRGEQIFKSGLHSLLKNLNPDIVQIFQVESRITWQVYFSKIRLGFKLFSSSHVLKSVFPLADEWSNLSAFSKIKWNLKHKIPGKWISRKVEKFYYQTEDAMEIAIEFYGASKIKSQLDPLGVDTNLFKPGNTDFRDELGLDVTNFVCIYTGRFSEGKSPLILAEAVHSLADRFPNIKALFLGNGPQEEAIKKNRNCIVRPFVPFQQLPSYYQSANLGIWPREESTSMLDAMASGLPIIISDKVRTIERIEGNGLMYEEFNVADLAEKIVGLYNQPELYKRMSNLGIEKIHDNYSWDAIAKKRAEDYLKSLKDD